LFRDGARAIADLPADEPGELVPSGSSVKRVELTLKQGMYFARATRQGRRVLTLMVGRGADVDAARAQLDAVFPLVEALVP
jgi:hypothetical protein